MFFGLAEQSRWLNVPPETLPHDHVLGAQLWRQAWADRARDLRSELEQTGSHAFAVEGSAHRDILFDALASASHRLLIESPTIGAVATAAPFVRAILGARARGVDIAIRYAEREPAGPDGDARWGDLEKNGVRLLQADTHAKVLVCDGWAVVGSFNLLSFEGRGRRELGVQVVDPATADAVAARFQG